MNRTVLTSFTIFCFLSTVFLLGLSFNIQIVRASGTIYVRADGSIEPLAASISSVDNVTYVLTDDIYDEIVIERNNITVDGKGHVLCGLGDGIGFSLTSVKNVTIQNTEIQNYKYGIWLYGSSRNTFFGNNMTDNYASVYLYVSSGNTFFGNNMANNEYGIRLYGSSNSNTFFGNNMANNYVGVYFFGSSNSNTFFGNNMANNYVGVYFFGSSNSNTFFHNNLVDNTQQVDFYVAGVNFWDNGFEGNYWSDYTGGDLDNDGIGDFSYVMDASNTDNYPLMGMFSEFSATAKHDVQTICNSSISDFQFNGTVILFDVSGENDTAGFCRICIPKALMNETYRVLVNGTEILPAPLPLPCSNNTHTYLYFTYNHSTQEVIIIPEFASFLVLPLFMIATLLAVIVYKKRAKSDRFYKR
jgi:parallel beta-helix repeat protein